jgi:hypothetical protein
VLTTFFIYYSYVYFSSDELSSNQIFVGGIMKNLILILSMMTSAFAHAQAFTKDQFDQAYATAQPTLLSEIYHKQLQGNCSSKEGPQFLVCDTVKVPKQGMIGGAGARGMPVPTTQWVDETLVGLIEITDGQAHTPSNFLDALALYSNDFSKADLTSSQFVLFEKYKFELRKANGYYLIDFSPLNVGRCYFKIPN